MKKTNFWDTDITAVISRKINTAVDWWSSIWQSLFPTASTSGIDITNISTRDNIIKRRTRPTVDLTFPNTVNYDLAMDLYYNRRPGYKLGAFFCYSIISIPLTFMGFPHFDVEDWEKVNNAEWWEGRFKFYNEKMMMDKQDIQKLCHITGTVGIFPWFSTTDGYVKLYFIKSKYIKDVYYNPDTQEMTGLKTEIHYIFTWEDGKEYNFIETKKYTKNKITTIRTGSYPPQIRGNVIKRNPSGELPVLFTNDKERGEFEGHSDFQRIIPLVKAYAEVALEANKEVLSMKAKLVQKVENKKTWLEANGYADVTEVEIDNVDFIINIGEEESRFEVPQHIIENHIQLLNLLFWNIVQTSKIPEIFWGLEATGNLASAGKQDKFGLAFIDGKKQQAQQSYTLLLNIIMTLDAMAYNQTPPENMVCTWDDFDSMTEVERSQIFDNWCSGFEKLTANHSIDLQGIHKMLLQLTKGEITENYEDFVKQIKEYGSMRSFLDQEFGGMRDFNQDDETGNGNGNGDKEEIAKQIEKSIITKGYK